MDMKYSLQPYNQSLAVITSYLIFRMTSQQKYTVIIWLSGHLLYLSKLHIDLSFDIHCLYLNLTISYTDS